MGFKTRQGMWCDYCQIPVAGQKSTHRARNTVAALSAPLTGGLSLAGAKSGEWHCPNCGQSVRKARPGDLAKQRHSVTQQSAPTASVDPDAAVTLMISGALKKRHKSDFGWEEAMRLVLGGETYAEIEARVPVFLASLPQEVGPFDSRTASALAQQLQRAGLAATERPVERPSPEPPAAGTARDPVQQLADLAAMYRAGQLTDEEFAQMKARVMGGS